MMPGSKFFDRQAITLVNSKTRWHSFQTFKPVHLKVFAKLEFFLFSWGNYTEVVILRWHLIRDFSTMRSRKKRKFGDMTCKMARRHGNNYAFGFHKYKELELFINCPRVGTKRKQPFCILFEVKSRKQSWWYLYFTLHKWNFQKGNPVFSSNRKNPCS